MGQTAGPEATAMLAGGSLLLRQGEVGLVAEHFDSKPPAFPLVQKQAASEGLHNARQTLRVHRQTDVGTIPGRMRPPG